LKFDFRRAEYLVAHDYDDSLPYCIAAGNIPLSVRFLIAQGQHSDAMLVAAAADEGLISSVSPSFFCPQYHTESADKADQAERYLSKVI
jgi:hypothetical protein